MLYYRFWKLGRVKKQHDLEVGEEETGKHGQGVVGQPEKSNEAPPSNPKLRQGRLRDQENPEHTPSKGSDKTTVRQAGNLNGEAGRQEDGGVEQPEKSNEAASGPSSNSQNSRQGRVVKVEQERQEMQEQGNAEQTPPKGSYETDVDQDMVKDHRQGETDSQIALRPSSTSPGKLHQDIEVNRGWENGRAGVESRLDEGSSEAVLRQSSNVPEDYIHRVTADGEGVNEVENISADGPSQIVVHPSSPTSVEESPEIHATEVDQSSILRALVAPDGASPINLASNRLSTTSTMASFRTPTLKTPSQTEDEVSYQNPSICEEDYVSLEEEKDIETASMLEYSYDPLGR